MVMDLVYSVFFGGGVAVFAYAKLGKRLGYGNPQNVWAVTAIAFFMGAIVFYTLIVGVFHIH